MDGFAFRGMVLEGAAGISSVSQVEVYPNPASYLININLDFSLSLKTPTLLVIRDAQGREVHSEIVKFALQQFTLNTTDWVSGAYFYELSNKNELLKSGKIEVIH